MLRVFCEEKHKKIRRRFDVGTHTYIQYQIKRQEQLDMQSFADISISGNPNTFRVGVEEKDGKVIINSVSRISYTYLRHEKIFRYKVHLISSFYQKQKKKADVYVSLLN